MFRYVKLRLLHDTENSLHVKHIHPDQLYECWFALHLMRNLLCIPSQIPSLQG